MRLIKIGGVAYEEEVGKQIDERKNKNDPGQVVPDSTQQLAEIDSFALGTGPKRSF
jgi:hypothetical protein